MAIAAPGVKIELLSGNEAVALGAYEAGVSVAAAYPGTPSTEILDKLSRYPGVYCEWSSNEKVALDVAIGAAYVGRRALAAMKHVGLNVAADSFFYASMTGTQAGLVIVSADDPNMYSSQNEQDNRQYARFAKIAALEPGDSEEARAFTKLAFEIGERFDCPVMLRSVTRIAHSKSAVRIPDPLPEPVRPSQPAQMDRNPAKYVMVPGFARGRHPVVEDRLLRMAAYAEHCPVNRIIPGDSRLGIITAGVAYQYAREVFPEASFLKLGMVYPLPREMIRCFARTVERVLVVEELDPFVEEHVRLLGIEAEGKRYFPLVGELTPDIVRAGAQSVGLLPSRLVGAGVPACDPGVESSAPAGLGAAASTAALTIPSRPPVLCVGCGHRAVFYVLKKLKLTVQGDIGCYTLGVVPPLSSIDSCGCMGASIGVAHGALAAGASSKTVAVIGDSTFFHSGLAPLVNVIYNQGTAVTIILDNNTAAMTGHQGHPGNGQTLGGAATPPIAIEQVVRGLGVEDVTVVEAYDLVLLEKTLKRVIGAGKPAVVVARHPCVLQIRQRDKPLVVDEGRCNLCGLCLNLGCQAIVKGERSVSIAADVCIGCGVCASTCARKAIHSEI